MNKICKYGLMLALLFAISGCKSKKTTTKENTTTIITTKVGPEIYNDKDIVILNTTDVHCAIDDDDSLDYSGVSAYKKLLSMNKYVSLVDSGDFIQGGLVGAISRGEYIIDIMNGVGYDVATMGNHEFDYGVDVLSDRISQFNGDVLSCNISYTGKGENKISEVKPYTIKTFGIFKVGYVGVTTPETLVSSNPKNFKEDGEIVYDFSSNTATTFYNTIQTNIDACKAAGADYIILLSHTGTNDENIPFRSTDIINNTTGYIALMDGHTHDTVNWKTYKDKDGKDILYCEAGTKLNSMSTLTIKKNGDIETNFIAEYDKKDEAINTYISTINAKVDELKNKVLATIDISLYDDDNLGSGVRLVRSRETALGNMVADSYRIMMEADIAFINGGGIRADLLAGEVTYGEIQNVHPFGNAVVTKKVLGSQILDYLEFNSRATQHIYKDTEGNKVGESGGFANVSGLKYTIDTSFESTVVTDLNGNFISVAGDRRVKNVEVLVNGTYEAIDPNAYYIVASNDYILVSGGDGNNMFLEDELIPNEQYLDYEVVIDYIVNELHGNLASKYSSTEGRITIEYNAD